VTKPIVLM